MADRRNTGDGFTLIEVVVVTLLIGIVAVTIAAVFSVIVRTAPATESRSDDSRSLLGLTNLLSQDVASASELGFEDFNDPDPDRCDLTGRPASTRILQLWWTEGSGRYVADYRWEAAAGVGRIIRYTCRESQPARRSTVSGDLREVSTTNRAPIPVNLNLVATTTQQGFPGHRGVKFAVVVVDNKGVQRELLSLDATTTNVRTTLPPISGGPSASNQPPNATPGSTTATAGATTVYALPATDPNGDALTATFTAIPSGWLLSASGLNASITPPAAAVPGVYVMNYIVTDTSGATATNTLTVTVSAANPNQPPVAPAVTTNATAGVQFTVALPASDPEGGALTATVTGVPGNWGGPTISGLNVTLTPHANAAGTYAFTYKVTDPLGASSSSTLTVNVCDAAISSVAPGAVDVNLNGSLKNAVQVTITSNGFCNPLVLGFKLKSSDAQETTEAFNAGNTTTIDTTEYVWEVPTGNRNVTLNLRQGPNGPIEDSRTLQMKK